MTNEELRERLDQFIDDHGGMLTTALEVYAEYMRKEAESLQVIFEAIRADKDRAAAQDRTRMTTRGLGMSAGIFRDSAERADRTRAALNKLMDELSDDEGEDS